MKDDFKIIAIIIITLLTMFATSLLLDLEIVEKQFVRKIIVYIAILIELYFGYVIYNFFKTNSNGR